MLVIVVAAAFAVAVDAGVGSSLLEKYWLMYASWHCCWWLSALEI